MGFNGSERRMMQLLNAIVKNQQNTSELKLIWLQGPGHPGPLFNELEADAKESLQKCKIEHINTFLMQLYSNLSKNSFKSSINPYNAILSKPFESEILTHDLVGLSKVEKRKPVHVFKPKPDLSSANSSSMEAARFIKELDEGYTIIFVDLVNHHTVEGVIADFFNQIHQIDKYAPSGTFINIPNNQQDEVFKKLVERICDVLKRGRYVVFLDSVEAFTRPHMTHHGYTQNNESAVEQIDRLSVFLQELVKLDNFWNSYIIIVFNPYRPRHPDNSGSKEQIHKDISGNFKENTKIKIHEIVTRNDDFKDYTWKYEINAAKKSHSIQRAKHIIGLLSALRNAESDSKDEKNIHVAFISLLSIFRVPRPLPLIRTMIERWGLREIGNISLNEKSAEESCDYIRDLIKYLSTKHGSDKAAPLYIEEGGIIRLNRTISEQVYNDLTDQIYIYSWKIKLKEKKEAVTDKDVVNAIIDGFIVISWHLFAARAYYADIFLPTHDITAFYEYLYHRVSAMRSISLLIAILSKGESNSVWGKLNDACEKIDCDRVYGADSNNVVSYIKTIGVFDSNFDPDDITEIKDVNDLISELENLRLHALKTFQMAIIKNGLFFRSIARADIVLAWSEQFVCNENNELDIISGSCFELKPSKEIKEIIEILKGIFHEYRFRAKFSKMDYDSLLSENNKLEKDKFVMEEYQRYMNQAKCLVETCHPDAQGFVDWLYSKVEKEHNEKILRNVLALKARSRFSSWAFWQPLLERSQIDHDNEQLNDAAKFSVLYENLIRETTETNDKDAIYRSTALTIRARSLYLRGYFPQAHQQLDLASTGLYPDKIEHMSLLSIVHIVRAELLAISADKHYPPLKKQNPADKQDSQKMKEQEVDCSFSDDNESYETLANSSLKKIKRAEYELSAAKKLLDPLKHQNTWQINLQLGWVQIQLERMLLECDLLFFSPNPLSENIYLKKNGDLERRVINCMHKLRNILDLIPYQVSNWDEAKGNQEDSGRSLFRIECSVYKIWRQLFVVGAFYSALLYFLYSYTNNNSLSNKSFSDITHHNLVLILTYINYYDKEKYQKKWQQWCLTMRFVNLAKYTKLNIESDSNFDRMDSVSLRDHIINIMKNQSSDKFIQEMWAIRRE